MKKLSKLILPFVLILALFLTACNSSDSTSGDSGKDKGTAATEPAKARTDKDTLTIALDADPPQMDPHLSTAAVDRQVYQALYNKLIDVDENLKFVPELATKWDISEDGKTYTFTLRDDVFFQDGTKFNAEAVKSNFERMLNPDFGSPRLSEINLIDNIKVVNDSTIQIHLKEPYSPFLAVLTDRAGMMVSPTAVKKEGKDFANNPVGTGPYKFVDRVKQDHITLERFDKYWGDAPKIKMVVYKPFPDGNTRVTNLISGNVDLVNKFDYKDIDRLEKDDSIAVSHKEALGFAGIQLNVKKAPFDNKKVRQAINIALDRAAIAKVVFHDGVTPGVSPFPSSSWAFPKDLKVPKADPEKAKQLIKESGVADPSFTLKIAPSPENKQLGQIIQSMLGQAGIKVKLEMVEFGALLDQTDNGEFQAANISWSGRTDPDGNAYSWFATGGALNYMSYSNPEVDNLLKQARKISDQGERTKLYAQVSQDLYDDAPYIFLYYPKDYKAMKKDVGGFVQIADTMIRPETIFFK